AQDEFAAHAVGRRERLGAVRVAHHLRQALAVAQVDEDHAAVVAPTVRQAAELPLLADERGRELGAIVRAHGRAYLPWPGKTTPIEMMYLSAESTDMASSFPRLA